MITGILELADWVVYDETTFAPGDLDFDRGLTRNLFQIPVGQHEVHSHRRIPGETQGQNHWRLYIKNFLRTNMLQAGMLDSPCSMVVRRLNVLFLNDDRPLRLFETSAYRNTTLEFSINRKIYWASPAWQCASPFALFDTPKQEIAAMKEKYGIDWEKVGASFDENPLTIHTQEYFTVRVQMDREPEERLSCHVYLDGIEARAVM